jgi:NhaP-type Na+/H+ or K+/H+ antiporter
MWAAGHAHQYHSPRPTHGSLADFLLRCRRFSWKRTSRWHGKCSESLMVSRLGVLVTAIGLITTTGVAGGIIAVVVAGMAEAVRKHRSHRHRQQRSVT